VFVKLQPASPIRAGSCSWLFLSSTYLDNSSLPQLSYGSSRDEKPVTATPLLPTLTNRDARNSFRFRSYEKWGGTSFKPSVFLIPSSSAFPRNSFALISFTDPHPLTLLKSYRFKKRGGEGVFQTFRRVDVPTSHPLSPLDATLMDRPASVANKRLTVVTKPFKCNTYKKQGGYPLQVSYRFTSTFRRWDVPTFRRVPANP
jgi:hypothetical protein